MSTFSKDLESLGFGRFTEDREQTKRMRKLFKEKGATVETGARGVGENSACGHF